jgi:hypothetical protein
MPAGGKERTTRDSSEEHSGAYPWDEKSQGETREKCMKLTDVGYSWTAVRWKKANQSGGCLLAYNCANDDIRSAVDSIIGIAGSGWEKRESPR